MNQLRKAKSRRHAVLPRKYIKVVVTYVLLFAIVFSNMSNPLLNVFAGQKKEEFRIHADELQRAAEEALEEGNIVEEPLDFYTKDSSLLKEYEELFAADGTLYEIFPDYEREYYLDDIELRIFLRISPDADPDSYALTGEETLIFLYTNGGEETVAGRVNIDGYISGICSLKSYMTAFEKKENSGSHNSGNSSSSGTKTEPGIDPSETETAEEVPGTDQEPTDDGEKNSQVDSETEEVKEPEASDAGKNDDEDKSHEDGSGADNSNTENNGSDNEEMRMMPLKTLRTRTRKKILLIMKIQKILVPIMRTREKKHPTTVTLPRMPVIQQTIQTTAVHLIQLLPFLSIPEFS